MGFMPPLSLGPPVVRPFKTTVVRPGGNLTRMFLAHTVPAIKSIPTSTKSETRFIDCSFRSELVSVKTDTLLTRSMSSKRLGNLWGEDDSGFAAAHCGKALPYGGAISSSIMRRG